MSFLNPLFLFGLLAAAIPVIIHLFTRRRPREVPFPSLEFAAIALAMARPALRGSVGTRAQLESGRAHPPNQL